MIFETLVLQTQILSNDIVNLIFVEVFREILVVFLVIVLFLHFGNLAISFLENI